MSRLVIIAPLRPGGRERALSLLREGPPFDLDTTKFDRHQVFLTEREAVFVFEGLGPPALDLPGEDPRVWRAAEAWAECLAERPRVARTAFCWERPDESEGVAFAATPGPGDGDGGGLNHPNRRVAG